MTSSSDLNTYNEKGDAQKFFCLYENVIMKHKSYEGKGNNLLTNLTAKAFDYYCDSFTIDNGSTATEKDYPATKRLILERFAPERDTALIMRDTVTMRYQGGEVRVFIDELTKHIATRISEKILSSIY